MKGNIPLFLRLTLVVILAVSFSLVPMAVEPQTASAAVVALATKDIIVEVGTSLNQTVVADTDAGAPTVPGDVQRKIAGPNKAIPSITVNVGDTVTIKPGQGTGVFDADPVAAGAQPLPVTTGINTADSGFRNMVFADTYAGTALGNGDFNSGAAISITLAGSPVTTVPASPTVGTGATGDAGVGKFFPISFKIPAISKKSGAAPAILKISDGATDITVNVIVNPKMQFTPDKASKGGTITVTGTGFTASRALDLEVRSKLTFGGAGTVKPPILTFPFNAFAHAVEVEVLGAHTLTVPAGFSGTVISGSATVTGSPLLVNFAGNPNPVPTTTTGNFFVTQGATASTIAVVGAAVGVIKTYPSTAADTAIGAGLALIQDVSTVSVTTAGSFTVTLPAGVTGTAISGTSSTSANATVTGSPLALVAGPNTVTATTGQFTIDMAGTLVAPSQTVSQGVVSTDATGSFSATFAAPELMSGTTSGANSINARDGANSFSNATELTKDIRNFAMNPSMTINPKTGGAGSVVTIDGSEFPASITGGAVTIGGIQVAVAAAIAASDANGKVTAFQVNIPLGLTPGTKSVGLNIGGQGASSTFTVSSAALSISPATGPKNREVVINVKEMPAGGVLTAVTFGTTPATLPTTTVTADTNGAASFTVRVPFLPQTGAVDVAITLGGSTATGTYTVSKPTIAISPTEQTRTGAVTVTGAGWVPGKNVSVNVAAGVTQVNAIPDAAGGFTASFTVDADRPPDSNDNVTAQDTAPTGLTPNTADTVVLHVPATSVTVTPSVAKWGETITVSGKGFPGGVQAMYGFPWTGAVGAASFSPAVYTDAAGNFTAKIVVPTLSTGVRSIGISAGGASATSTVEVSEAPATIATALAPIAAQLVRVWGFDAASQSWKLYDPSVPAELNTLSALVRGSGYFINVKAATTITTASGNTVPLSPGWQILGW